MNKEKQPSSSTAQGRPEGKPAKNQFLKDVKDDLGQLLQKVLTDHNQTELEHVLGKLYPFVEEKVKQSFKNGTEAGYRQAYQKKSPKFKKPAPGSDQGAEQAEDDAVEKQAEKDKQDNSRY